MATRPTTLGFRSLRVLARLGRVCLVWLAILATCPCAVELALAAVPGEAEATACCAGHEGAEDEREDADQDDRGDTPRSPDECGCFNAALSQHAAPTVAVAPAPRGLFAAPWSATDARLPEGHAEPPFRPPSR